MVHTHSMPASYTHHLIAHTTYLSFDKSLQEKLQSHLNLYYFGAQGADFCFFYPYVSKKIPNLGSYLHRKGGYTAFSLLQLFAKRYPLMLAYALGFITHYAADTTFHPYVYARAGQSPVKHNRIEYALDEYFKKEKPIPTQHLSFLHAPLSTTEQKELFYAYSAISTKCGFPALRFSSFSKAITLFNAYLPITYPLLRTKKEEVIQDAANVKKQAWTPVFSPNHARYENANELFTISVNQTISLSQKFLQSIIDNTSLPREIFSKSFLTGI